MSDLKPLLIVSEAARQAAVALVQDHYQVLSYLEASDDLLRDRNVLFWPAAGEPGLKKRTMKYAKVAHELKRISTVGQPRGWDAASAAKDGWLFDTLVTWARQHVDKIPYIPEAAEETGPNESQYARLEKLGVGLSESGKPICNAGNVVRYIKADKLDVWYDDFSARVMTPDGPWTDADTTHLMISLQNDLAFHRITSTMVHDGIHHAAMSHRRHVVRDWLQNLRWDGQKRIGTFFSTYMGAEPNASTHAFSNNFWVLMVKRILHPGCQADYMVVLEGAQGIGKTRAFQIIGGTWYAEVGITADAEDFERQLQGKILVEIAELHSFSKADQTRVKQIITKRIDRYREKYGKFAEDHPRQGILVGTTNETEWIKDQTGGRRFWPVRCGIIDIDAIQRDREQLFAEAIQCLKEGDEGYLVPKEETLQVQEVRREQDEWESILARELAVTHRVTLTDAAAYLKVTIDKLGIREQKRIGSVLRQIGFKRTTLRNEGVLQKIWVKNGVSDGVTG